MEYALIVAGGKGSRMGNEIPKQFLSIGGKPILMRTMEIFHAYNPEMKIILVLPHNQQSFWSRLCGEYDFSLKHTVVDGGDTRFHSVKNGLEWVEAPGLVGVHDGVRPFVSQKVIGECYRVASQTRAAVPVMDMVESVRLVEDGGSRTVDRQCLKLVQTPQVFDVALLKGAYEQPYSPSFTDDASVVESFGAPVTLVPGNRENIKITTPFDLKVAAALLDSCSI